MKIIPIEISNRKLAHRITDVINMHAGENESTELEFSFDEEWLLYTDRKIIFKSPGKVTIYPVSLVDNKVLIPEAALDKPGNLLFNVEGINGDVVIKTSIISIPVGDALRNDGVIPGEYVPSGDVLAELASKVDKVTGRGLSVKNVSSLEALKDIPWSSLEMSDTVIVYNVGTFQFDASIVYQNQNGTTIIAPDDSAFGMMGCWVLMVQPVATITANGLMSKEDKIALNGMIETSQSIIYDGTTVLVGDDGAGMFVSIDEYDNEIVDVGLYLKGLINVSSFGVCLKFDKTKVMPVYDATFLGTVLLTDSASLENYVEKETLISTWLWAGNKIDNLNTSTDNFIYIAFSKPSPVSANISCNANFVTPILTMKFKKVSSETVLTDETFEYFKTPSPSVWSKIGLNTTFCSQANGLNAGIVDFSRFSMFLTPKSTTGFTLTVDSLSVKDLCDFGDSTLNDYGDAAWKTTLEIRETYNSELIEIVDFDATTKRANLLDIPNGNYVIGIKRAGYLQRWCTFEVEDKNLYLGNKILLPGDVNEDGTINGQDSGTVFSVFGSAYGDASYNPVYDFNGDLLIDEIDAQMLYKNFNLDFSVYNETVDFEA